MSLGGDLALRPDRGVGVVVGCSRDKLVMRRASKLAGLPLALAATPALCKAPASA